MIILVAGCHVAVATTVNHRISEVEMKMEKEKESVFWFYIDFFFSTNENDFEKSIFSTIHSLVHRLAEMQGQ